MANLEIPALSLKQGCCITYRSTAPSRADECHSVSYGRAPDVTYAARMDLSGEWATQTHANLATGSSNPRIRAVRGDFAGLRGSNQPIGAPGFEPGTSPTRTV